MPKRLLKNGALRVALIFAAISGTWKLLSDLTLHASVTDSDRVHQLQLLKSWAWVIGSAVVVYFLVRNLTRELSAARATSQSAGEALRAAEVEHVRAEERLRRDLRDLNFALDQSTILAVTDRRGLITDVNDNFCKISRYSREELLGKDHRIINSGLHSKAFFQEMWETIQAGRVWHGQIRNRAKDRTLYWVDTTIVPFMGEDGKPYQFMAIRHDVTERKLAEEKLQEQESLARLGEMAAVVAHEVKNPLAGISGAIQIIGGRLPEDSRERKVVGDILARIDALNGRIQDMLQFARPKAPKPTGMPVSALLQPAVDHASADPIFSGIKLSVTSADIQVLADAAMIQEILLNLLLNAAQAMNGKGEITIRATNGVDKQCRIEISDTGPGVPADQADRIFKPFVTTKHQGTGLGLSIARRVAQDHGGDLKLVGKEPPGATFVLELPCTI